MDCGVPAGDVLAPAEVWGELSNDGPAGGILRRHNLTRSRRREAWRDRPGGEGLARVWNLESGSGRGDRIWIGCRRVRRGSWSECGVEECSRPERVRAVCRAGALVSEVPWEIRIEGVTVALRVTPLVVGPVWRSIIADGRGGLLRARWKSASALRLGSRKGDIECSGRSDSGGCRSGTGSVRW